MSFSGRILYLLVFCVGVSLIHADDSNNMVKATVTQTQLQTTARSSTEHPASGSASTPVSKISTSASTPVSKISASASTPVSKISASASTPVSKISASASTPVSKISVSASTPVSKISASASTPGPKISGSASTPGPKISTSASTPGPKISGSASTPGPKISTSASTPVSKISASASTPGPKISGSASTPGPKISGSASTPGPKISTSASTPGPEISGSASTPVPTTSASASTSVPMTSASASTSVPMTSASASTSVPTTSASASTSVPTTSASASTSVPTINTSASTSISPSTTSLTGASSSPDSHVTQEISTPPLTTGVAANTSPSEGVTRVSRTTEPGNCKNNTECHTLAQCLDGMCHCDDRYEGNGIDECTDIDECKMKTILCFDHSSCKNTFGAHECICFQGYQISNDNSYCEDVNECQDATVHRCHEHSHCVNILGSFRCPCNTGFKALNETYCEDINECLKTNPKVCPNDAHCYNSIGSFLCICNTGYNISKDNSSCEDIDECRMTDAKVCPDHSSCTNNVGSYQCRCNEGYQMSKDNSLCEDVDECAIFMSCPDDANCTNIDGSYKCTCHHGYVLSKDKSYCKLVPICHTIECDNDGLCYQDGPFHATCLCPRLYTGPKCESRVDECALDPCMDHSHCNLTASGRSCTCNYGFEMVDETCVEKLMFRLSNTTENQFGKLLQDKMTRLPIQFPYFNEPFNCIYAHNNGYLSFGENYEARLPPPVKSWPNFPPLVSVHWTNLDFVDHSDGGLYVYMENRVNNTSDQGELLAFAEKKVKPKDSNFKPLAAVVFTWYDAYPDPNEQYQGDRLRVQVVFASDGIFTYMIRTYEITWTDKNKARRSRISFAYTNSKGGVSNDASKIPRNPKGGILVEPLFDGSPDNSDSYHCFVYISQLKELPKPELDPCPCTKEQAKRDPQFKLWEKNASCYRTKFWYKGWKQTCCYDAYGILQTNTKEASYPVSESTSTNGSYEKTYGSCCRGSSSFLCLTYYKNFPSDDCSSYVPKRGSGGFGDPHIINFDGDKFTFNILGDFILAQSGQFSLHGRTSKNEYNMTYFSAFAIQMRNGISPYIVESNETSLIGKWRDQVPNKATDFSNIDTKRNEISIRFQAKGSRDVIEVKFTKKPSEVALSYKVITGLANLEGILGNADQNNTNDFGNGRTGPAQELTGNSIQDFVKEWLVESMSLFNDTLPENGEEPFTPPNKIDKVMEELENKNLTDKSCGKELFCLQDYLATGNISSALDIKDQGEKLEKETKTPKPPCKFTNPPTLQWGRRRESLYLEAGDMNIFSVNSSLPEGIVQQDNANVTVDIENYLEALRNLSYPHSFRCIAMREDNGVQVVSEYQPHISLCLCNKTEQCREEASKRLFGDGNVFKMRCQCGRDSQGEFCEQELSPCAFCDQIDLCDATQDDPCICEKGYHKSESGSCYEIDECLVNKGGCDQICKNILGSFNCSCHEGYKQNGTHCLDIEECKSATLNHCTADRFCQEEDGSSSCQCYPGYGASNKTSDCIHAPYRYPVTFTLPKQFLQKDYNVTVPTDHKALAKLSKQSLQTFLHDKDILGYVEILELASSTTNQNQSTISVTGIIHISHHSDEKKLKQELTLPQGSSLVTGTLTVEDITFPNATSILCGNPMVKDSCDEVTTNCFVLEDNRVFCDCKAGFNRGSDPYHCFDVDECSTNNPCEDGATCTNTPGEFVCACGDGQEWNQEDNTCKLNPNPCDLDTCKNGATCSNAFGIAVCQCAYGWEGPNCEDEENEARKMKVAVIATSTVLGAFALILLIIIAVMCHRMRKNLSEQDDELDSSPDYASAGRLPRPKLSQRGDSNGADTQYESLDASQERVGNVYSSPYYRGSQKSSNQVYTNRAFDNSDKP